MVFLNKYILSVKNAPVEQLIIVQSIIASLCLLIIRIFHKFDIILKKTDIIACFCVNITFAVMIIANSFALKYLSIGMVTLLKCCTVVVTAFLDFWIIKHNLSKMMWFSLFLIVIGSVYGVKKDLDNSTKSPVLIDDNGILLKGYFWMCISILSMSTYAILSKILITNNNIHYLTASFWNNTICVIILPFMMMFNCFIDDIPDSCDIFENLYQFLFDDFPIIALTVFSGIVSLLLNITMYSMLGMTSATSYVVVSAGKKIVQAALSFVVFGTSQSSLWSIAIGLSGATLYAFLKWKEQKRLIEAREKAENESLLSSDSSDSKDKVAELFPLDPID